MIDFHATSQQDSISLCDNAFPMVENGLPRHELSPVTIQDGGAIVSILNKVKEEYKRTSDLEYIERCSIVGDYDEPPTIEIHAVQGVPVDLSINIKKMVSIENAAYLFRRLRAEWLKIEQNGWNLALLIQVCSLESFPRINLTGDEDYYPFDYESPTLLADTYERTIIPLVEQKQLYSLPSLWQEICNHGTEINTLWQNIMHGLRYEIDRLRASFEQTCQNKESLHVLIQKQVERTMSVRGDYYFRMMKEESSRNKYIIEKSRQDALNRMKRCLLNKYIESQTNEEEATWEEYVEAMTKIIKCKMRDPKCPEPEPWEFDSGLKVQTNEFWEFFSCAVQLHILESIKKGDTFPPKFRKIAVVTKAKSHIIFDSVEAEKIWKKLTDKGLLDEKRQLKPGVGQNDAAYIAMRFNEALAPKATRKVWKYFEDLWNLKGKLRSADVNKGQYPKNAQNIDEAFR